LLRRLATLAVAVGLAGAGFAAAGNGPSPRSLDVTTGIVSGLAGFVYTRSRP